MRTYTFVGPRLQTNGPIGGFGEENTPIQKAIIARIEELVKNAAPDFILTTGLGTGIETWAATAAAKHKKPFVVYIPFDNQDSVWPAKAKALYRTLLDSATSVEQLNTGGFTKEKMQEKEHKLLESEIIYSFYTVTPSYIAPTKGGQLIPATQKTIASDCSPATQDRDNGDFFWEL